MRRGPVAESRQGHQSPIWKTECPGVHEEPNEFIRGSQACWTFIAHAKLVQSYE